MSTTTKRKKAALAVIDDHPPPITDLNNPALAAAIGIDHALVVDPYRDVKVHAVKIKTSLQKGVSSIIEAGLDLIEAKKVLGHGKWLKLFDEDIGDLPIGKDTAQRYMKIAKHPILSNTANWPFLPPYWRTLHTLSRASEQQLESWLADGTVTAELQLVDAIALVNPPTLPAPSSEATSGRPEVVLPVSEASVPSSDEAVVQLKLQLGDEVAVRLEKTEASVQKLRDKTAALRLKNMDDSLCDAKVDWNKVIEAADPAMVRDILDQLESHLNEYNKAKKAETVKAETVKVETVH